MKGNSCEYISHCLGKKEEVNDYLCLTDKHESCGYFQLLENKKGGSIGDVRL